MEYRAPTREQKIRSVPDRRHPPDCLRGYRSEDCRCFVFRCLCSFYVCVPWVVPHSSIHNSFIHNSLIHNSLIHNSFGRDANRDHFQRYNNRHNNTFIYHCALLDAEALEGNALLRRSRAFPYPPYPYIYIYIHKCYK